MMKQVKFRMPLRMLALLCVIFLSATAFAQNITVKGNVKDATGEPIIGATVRAAGQDGGVITDFDGNFTMSVKQGTELTVSYIGYQDQKVAAAPQLSITLQDASQNLNEVVVIGYGVAKKTDLTGSVTALTPDSKNKGLVVNAQDMIQGKIAGVNITNAGGTPGAGATIRIRGGASLNASNDPLIVIDGVAMDNNGVQGLSNPLSLVNPQDIESFSVLKDASATAIYGSRGSNGVIIITTKKGHGGTKVSYNGSFTVSTKKKTLDVMDGDSFRDLITSRYGADSDAAKLLGTANTDWQDQIYRTAFSHDHAVTVSGTIGKVLPYRVSGGYTDQQGILKTSDFKRFTGSLNLSPTLLDDHLKINFNAKGMWAKSRFANTNAVSAAVWFDPTQSVYDYTSADAANFGNYFEWRDAGTALNNSKYPYTYYTLATKNPVALLNLKNDRAISRDLMVSGDIDYKVHGFEDLHLHVTGGADIADGNQNTDIDPTSPEAFYYGSYGFKRILKRNFQGSAYAMYTHDFKDKLENHFDIMAGAEESHFWRNQHNRTFSYSDAWNGGRSEIYTDDGVDYNGDGVKEDYHYKTENYLVSYFGRANWNMMDRYFVTFTFRADGSSRFKDHWGYFPSTAFMWKMKDENAFKDIKWLSDLKFRAGWGMTGQQEGISDYGYISNYVMNSGAQNYYYVVGNGNLARPNAFQTDLTGEKTTTYNLGLDWALFNRRVSGSFDWYYRKTTDLLNTVYVPSTANFRNQVTKNIGAMSNTGFEAAIKFIAVDTEDWHWTLDYNFTYNYNKITKLTGGDNSDYYVAKGGTSFGTGNNVQAFAVGHPAYTYYIYQQAYDKNGKPIEGVVVDRNGDGVITSADKYYYKQKDAPVLMGLASRLEWKNWDFGFSLRASLGNYVFNDFAAGMANCGPNALFTNNKYLTNRLLTSISDNFQTADETTTLTDYWVHNASFLKCDNITLGYSFQNLFKCAGYHGLAGRIYGTVNNVFTITNYKGLDPEIQSGIDRDVYPRPISFILGLSLNF